MTGSKGTYNIKAYYPETNGGREEIIKRMGKAYIQIVKDYILNYWAQKYIILSLIYMCMITVIFTTPRYRYFYIDKKQNNVFNRYYKLLARGV